MTLGRTSSKNIGEINVPSSHNFFKKVVDLVLERCSRYRSARLKWNLWIYLIEKLQTHFTQVSMRLPVCVTNQLKLEVRITWGVQVTRKMQDKWIKIENVSCVCHAAANRYLFHTNHWAKANHDDSNRCLEISDRLRPGLQRRSTETRRQHYPLTVAGGFGPFRGIYALSALTAELYGEKSWTAPWSGHSRLIHQLSTAGLWKRLAIGNASALSILWNHIVFFRSKCFLTRERDGGIRMSTLAKVSKRNSIRNLFLNESGKGFGYRSMQIG